MKKGVFRTTGEPKESENPRFDTGIPQWWGEEVSNDGALFCQVRSRCPENSLPAPACRANNRRKLERLVAQYRNIFSNISVGTVFLLEGVTENDSSFKRYKFQARSGVWGIRYLGPFYFRYMVFFGQNPGIKYLVFLEF